MEIDARSIVYQVVLIVALWMILKRMVFDRLLATLEKREERTRGAAEEARGLSGETASLRREYEGAIAAVRRQALAEKEEIRRGAEKEERDLVERVREEAALALQTVRDRTRGEVAAARADLERQGEELSNRVVKALLEEIARP